MHKTLVIPYINHRDVQLETLGALLETKGKRISIDTLNWEKEFPYAPICHATIAYSERGVLLHYFVRGLSLRALSPGDGNYVHEDSCVEFFMQPEAGDSYINFEFNAAGVCYAAHHKSVTESTLFRPEEFSSIARLASHRGGIFAEKTGLFNWEISVIIPWTTMGYPQGVIPTQFRANFYKCADGTQNPHYLSWSPIVEDAPAFHRPQFFGEIILGPRP